MDRGYRIAFVVLHYRVVQCTIDCIESILSLNSGQHEICIIAVDNGSGNGTGEHLVRRYEGNPRVHVAISAENRGFAQGNNLGYSIAKEMGCDFAVQCNSDVLFADADFALKIVSRYERSPFHILGPDVFNPRTKEHQSPIRLVPYTKDSVMQLRQSCVRELEKIDMLSKRVMVQVRSSLTYKKLKIKVKSAFDAMSHREVWKSEHYGSVLQGSCIIFSPLFLSCMEWAFFPKTFMYSEEGILNHIALKNGLTMVYSPDVQVLHMHGLSTSASTSDAVSKRKYFLTQVICSYDEYLQLFD